MQLIYYSGSRIKQKPVILNTIKSSHIINRTRKIIHAHNLFTDKDRLIVGVSGGSDSIGLLYILTKITNPDNLVVVYVDHGLRPREIPEEKDHISNCCHNLGVLFKCEKVELQAYLNNNKVSLEQGARTLRYEVFDQYHRQFNAHYIAVGHTADDQTEEFFIRLIRGTGSTGLSGMSLKRDRIIRPLLHLRKSEIENFLTTNQIGWCQDSSNYDEKILRNRVRHTLIPLLKSNFNQSFEKNVSETMEILRTEDQLLSNFALDGYDRSVTEHNGERLSITISIEPFLKEHLAIRRRILEKCFWKMGVRPTFDHIDQLIQICNKGVKNNELHLGNGIVAVCRNRHLQFIQANSDGGRVYRQTPDDYLITVNEPGDFLESNIGLQFTVQVTNRYNQGETPKELPTLELSLDKIDFPFVIRGAQPGERFKPSKGNGTKNIFRYYNEKKLPRSLRSWWPVMYYESEVVAVLGVDVESAHQATPSSTKVLKISFDPSLITIK